MSKIVRQHYPVSRLPRDLQDALGNTTSVRLTLEAVDEPTKSATQIALESARALRRSGKRRAVTSSEAVDRIRKLRDEWPS